MTRPIVAATVVVLAACGSTPTPGQRCLAPVVANAETQVKPQAKPQAPSLTTATGLAASRFQPGLVAVWDADTVVIHSKTRSSRRLPLPEDRQRVVAATFDHTGRLHLLSDSGLLLSWGPGPEPTRRQLDFARDTVLLTSTRHPRGGHLVWLGQSARPYAPPLIRASGDGGKTWSSVDAPEGGNAGLELFVELDGGLQLMSGFEAACGGGGQHRDRGQIGPVNVNSNHRRPAWTGLPWPLDAPYGWFLGPRGWAYARLEPGESCGDGGRSRLCAINSRKALEPVKLLGDRTRELARALEDWWPDEDTLQAENGRQALLAAGDLVVKLEGARARVLGRAPEGLTALALGTAGTSYALARGKLLRLSGENWRAVRESSRLASHVPSPAPRRGHHRQQQQLRLDPVRQATEADR